MPAALHCPKCGSSLPRYDWKQDQRLRAKGLCVDCRQPNPEAEAHWNCAACRAKRAQAMAATRRRDVP